MSGEALTALVMMAVFISIPAITIRMSRKRVLSSTYSSQHKSFLLSMSRRCPICNSIIAWRSPNVLRQDGTIISNAPRDLLYAEPGAEVQCPRCLKKWPMYDELEVKTSKEFRLLDIIETERIEEQLGTERRLVDNSSSKVEVERSFTVAKEWTKSSSIEYEKIRTSSNSSAVSIEVGVSIALKNTSEMSLKKKYGVLETETRRYDEHISVKIPPATKLQILLNWKRIWQCGIVKLLDDQDNTYSIPFKVAIGVTFDQSQTDEPV